MILIAYFIGLFMGVMNTYIILKNTGHLK